MDIEVIVNHISNVAPIYIYVIAFLFSYVENIFPPSPSDAVLVFIGYLVAVSKVHFLPVLLVSTFGGALGYLTMYKLGQIFGNRVVEKGKLKFISLERIHKIEQWFSKYGYWVVVGNRFLPGTRAVISFFNGLSNLNLTVTAILCTVSSLAWSALLIGFGMAFGKQWIYIEDYLNRYAILVTCIIGMVILVFIIRKNINKKKNK